MPIGDDSTYNRTSASGLRVNSKKSVFSRSETMCKSHGFGSFFHESSRMILFVEKIERITYNKLRKFNFCRQVAGS